MEQPTEIIGTRGAAVRSLRALRPRKKPATPDVFVGLIGGVPHVYVATTGAFEVLAACDICAPIQVWVAITPTEFAKLGEVAATGAVTQEFINE